MPPRKSILLIGGNSGSPVVDARGDIVGLGMSEVADSGGLRSEILLKVQDAPADKLVEVLRSFSKDE